MLHLSNPGTSTLDLTIQTYNTRGGHTIELELGPKATIQPLGSQHGKPRWVSIESSGDLAGFVQVSSWGANSDKYRFPISEVGPADQNLVFPQVDDAHPARTTTFILINTGEEEAQVQFKPYSADGVLLDELLTPRYLNGVTLEGESQLSATFSRQVFNDRFSTEKVAWVEVVSDQPLAGVTVYRGNGSNDVAALSAQSTLPVARPHMFSMSTANATAQQFTLTNASDGAGVALVQGFDDNGQTLFRQFVQMAARTQLTGQADADGLVFPAGAETPQIQLDAEASATLQSIRVSANIPVALYQIAASEGRGMAATGPAALAGRVGVAVPESGGNHQLLIHALTKSADNLTVTGYNDNGDQLYAASYGVQPFGSLTVDLPGDQADADWVEVQGTTADAYFSAFLRVAGSNGRLLAGHAAEDGAFRQHLADDAALQSPENPTMGEEPEAWVNWIAENHHPIRSLESEDFSDLCFLEEVLAGKRVVQLGENSHGIREYNRAKVRLIKFLHQELNYEVMAFESSMFSTYNTRQNLDSLSSFDALSQSIFGVWNTNEVIELFDYIKAQSHTDHPLILAGFDIQTTGFVVLQRPAWLAETIAAVDPEYAAVVEAADQEFVTNLRSGQAVFYPWFLPRVDEVRAVYADLVTWMDANSDALIAAFPDEPQRVLFARQEAWSAERFAANLFELTENPFNALQIRDDGMAVNVNFLLDQVFPDKKMIVWAHNGHLHKDGPELFWISTMGGQVAEARGDEVYTVGFYMGGGWSANNARQAYPVGPYPVNSLESILYNARRKHMFVDLLHQTEEPGNAWMFQQILGHDWGVIGELWTPRKQWDGIFYVDTTSTPYYSFQ